MSGLEMCFAAEQQPGGRVVERPEPRWQQEAAHRLLGAQSGGEGPRLPTQTQDHLALGFPDRRDVVQVNALGTRSNLFS